MKKVCLGNLLLFISQYMLIPILPVVMAAELDLSIAITGVLFLVTTLGMILVGPFYNYLMDIYSRRSLCIFAFTAVLIATAGYSFIHRPLELLALSIIQGLSFGVANSSIIALGIDVNISENRSKGNVIFGWFTRLGMILGVASGTAIYLNYNFETLVTASVVVGVAGVICITAIRTPFRAPIGVSLFSLDRFFLPRTFVFAFNMILIAFTPGVLIPLIHFKIRDTFLSDEWTVPYFVIAGGAFLLSVLFVGFIRKLPLWAQAIMGMTAIVCAVCSLILFNSIPGHLFSGILLGSGLSIITPAFISFFINLSNHCQRSTANTTHLLSWKIGIALGIATSCAMNDESASSDAFHVALLVSTSAVIFFIAVSYPYYRKRKVQGNRCF